MSIKNRFGTDSSILFYGDLARQPKNIEKNFNSMKKEFNEILNDTSKRFFIKC